MMATRELTITRVGAQGDGVSDGDDRTAIFVPFTLAQERVRATVDGDRGRLTELITQSSDRVEPVCRHFGTCGGCSLQHMATETYRNWKREQVATSFRARGLDVDVGCLINPGGKRRRAVFSVERGEAGIGIGFHEAASHALVDVRECPVLDVGIVASLPRLRIFLLDLLSRRGQTRVSVTLTHAGLDVVLDDFGKKLTPELRTRIASRATEFKFARVTLGSETIFEAVQPFLTFGTADVMMPPGMFVQAVAEAEHEIAALVIDAVGKAKSVADLFCGMGALTFPVAAKCKVSAFDSDPVAVDAVSRAVKQATNVKPITVRRRDLFREPLSALELNEHDAIVFDPPRAGAEAQAKMLAKSKVKTVVAVSCNPATLARDARILVDGGYRIERAVPIDQFLYSPHIEVVTVFTR